MKLRARRALALAGITLAAGAPSMAQSPLPGGASPEAGYVVRAGDTLWELARTYLSDPGRWEEIYQLNRATITDPRHLRPGDRLRLPDGAAATSGEQAAVPSQVNTVFAAGRAGAPRRHVVSSERLEPLGAGVFPVVRVGEAQAAPYTDAGEAAGIAGRVLRGAELTRIASSGQRSRLQLEDEIFVAPPKGALPDVGDRYLVVAPGARLADGLGRVMVPTGVVEVVRAGSGDATTVRLVRQFDRVEPGQELLPLDSSGVAADQRAVPVSGGLESKVVYVHEGEVMPNLQQYLIVNVGTRRGVHAGDRVTLYAPREAVTGELATPERTIATAQVVRATPWTATIIVLNQQQAAIAVGMHARVTARIQ